MSERGPESRPLYLVRTHLNAIPEAAIPEGLTLVPLTGTADNERWLALIRTAERLQVVEEDAFARAYGVDDREITKRVFFLLDHQGAPVATVGAWYGSGEWAGWGRIHWLYVLPQYQGYGLGKSLLSFGLKRLQELGHHAAYLKTSTARTAAVRLYQAYGFREESDTA